MPLTWRDGVAASLILIALFGPSLMPVPKERADLNQLLQEFQTKLSNPEVNSAIDRYQQIQSGAELTPQEKAMLKELQQARGQIQAPVLDKLLTQMPFLSGATDLAGPSFLEQARAVWEKVLARAKFWMWALPAILLTLGGGALAAGSAPWTRRFAGYGQSLASPWLGMLALSAAGVSVVTRSNAWTSVPAVLYVPPVLLIVGCAWLFRRSSTETSGFSVLVSTLLAPVLSMLFGLALPYVLPHIL